LVRYIIRKLGVLVENVGSCCAFELTKIKVLIGENMVVRGVKNAHFLKIILQQNLSLFILVELN